MSSRKAKRGLTSRHASTQANKPGEKEFSPLRDPQAIVEVELVIGTDRVAGSFTAEEAAMAMLNGGYDAASTPGWVVKECGCKFPVGYIAFDASFDLDHIATVVWRAMIEAIEQVRSLNLAECISPTCTANPPHKLPC